MASITVTPLNNGITLTAPETIKGMLSLSGAYLYYTSAGNIYYQANSTTAATLLLASGFPIVCATSFFDGVNHTIFLGGSAGNYVFGTIDTTGTSTLATKTSGALNFTAVAFDVMSYLFLVGTDTGELHTSDVTTGALTLNQTLTAPALPSGSTLVISKICYDLVTNNYLIVGHASANTNTANPSNYSVVYAGALATLHTQDFVGRHLWLGAIGQIENSSGVRVPKLVVAGEDCKIYHSDDWLTWTQTLTVDQAIQINSLTFNTWVFVGGLLYGIVLLSTNGTVWESSYDAQITADIVDVESA